MNAKLQKRILEGIKTRLAELGMSPSEAAEKAGLASTTLTRPMNDPDHEFILSTKTLGKLCDVLQCSFVEMMEGRYLPLGRNVLGDSIRAARKAKDLGQADIADQLGVTVQAVSQWERNETMPSGINLLKLSGILGIDLPHDFAKPGAVHPHAMAAQKRETREGVSHAPSRVSELREYIEEITDLLHALDKIGDGIGGADGYAVSAVALQAKSLADKALGIAKAMEAK